MSICQKFIKNTEEGLWIVTHFSVPFLINMQCLRSSSSARIQWGTRTYSNSNYATCIQHPPGFQILCKHRKSCESPCHSVVIFNEVWQINSLRKGLLSHVQARCTGGEQFELHEHERLTIAHCQNDRDPPWRRHGPIAPSPALTSASKQLT